MRSHEDRALPLVWAVSMGAIVAAVSPGGTPARPDRSGTSVTMRTGGADPAHRILDTGAAA